METPGRPLLVYDGHCAFCRAWVDRWLASMPGAIDVAPSQEVADRLPQVPRERFVESVVLVEPGGATFFGAAAVFRALSHAPRRGLAWWAYQRLPGFAPASEMAYRLVARNRDAAMGVTRALWGAHLTPPGERVTAWIFVRLVCVTFVVAFASLASQLRGLVGSDGILPAAPYLRALAERVGPERLLLLPTLAWLHASDAFLMTLCATGLVAATLGLIGFAPRAMLLAAWGCYLSLSSVGGEFLWFQWDSLLLETALVAALLAPWSWWSPPRGERQPSRAAVRLARWLLFRLELSSAAVKWLSGDPTWRHFTALRYHYETQPLPTPLAWYAHHLPAALAKWSVLATFGIEGFAPLLFLAPRRARMLAAAALVLHQALIALTGNYGFFNLLTVTLCVMLLDDGAWPAWLRARFAPRGQGDAAPPRRQRAVAAVALSLGVLGACPLASALRVPPRLLGPLPALYGAIEPFRSVNPYGLFAVMTTRRLEITVEGSDDGRTWRPYAFRWKPGDPRERPGFLPGHMPRLDWQMWFAALEPARPAYWFLRFVRQLLSGSKPVLALLRSNPFPEHPPRFVRASLELYRFSGVATRRASGAWWTREPVAPYLPPLMLSGGELVLADSLAASR
jgi:predicted DCC family thiol-disulfide oxidoreductase YuxK